MPTARARLPALEWRPQASADLMDIVAAIADDNPDAAQMLKGEIEAKAAKLPQHPKLYKPSQRVKGTREVVIRSDYMNPGADRDRQRGPCTSTVAASAQDQTMIIRLT